MRHQSFYPRITRNDTKGIRPFSGPTALTDGELWGLRKRACSATRPHRPCPPRRTASILKRSAAKYSPRGGQCAGADASLFAEAAACCPPVPPLAEPRSASFSFSCLFVCFVDLKNQSFPLQTGVVAEVGEQEAEVEGWVRVIRVTMKCDASPSPNRNVCRGSPRAGDALWRWPQSNSRWPGSGCRHF
jgi:hypothetical protein